MSFQYHLDHVGSLLRPADLLQAFHTVEETGREPENLRQLQDRAIANVVRLQEEIGLRTITDGEFRRRSWQRGMFDAIGGIALRPGPLRFWNNDGVTNPMAGAYIEKRIRRSRPITVEEFKSLRPLSNRMLKVTMPAPTKFHFGLFSKCVDQKIYPDIDEMFADLLQVYTDEMHELHDLGCTYLQFDEVALPILCDSNNRAILRDNGEDPEAIIDLYFNIDRQLLQRKPQGLTIAMHLCRGNQAGLWSGDGGYESIAERLFNEIDADVFLLEYDSERAGDFAPLRHLPRGKKALLGLVSTKSPTMEEQSHLIARINQAAQHAPLERLGLCPQCGFSSSISLWNKTENPMTEEIQKRKLELVVSTANCVWRQ